MAEPEVAVTPSDPSADGGQVATIPVSTTPASMIGDDGNFVDTWRNTLPEDIRDETCLGTCKSVEGMARQYINAQKMIGKDKVALLNEHSTEADKEAWALANGRPVTAEDYGLKRPDEFPEELFSADYAKTWQERFFKYGVSKEAAEAMFRDWNQDTLQARQNADKEIEAKKQQAEDDLRAEKGTAYDQQLHYANVAIAEGVDGNEEFQKLVTDRFGNDTDFIRLMMKLGSKFAEHGVMTVPSMPTPSDIQVQIDEIMATPEYRGGPGISPSLHRTVVQKVARLFEEKAKNEAGQTRVPV